ncbi:hypothetical protein VRB37_09575 [Erwinia billingiae]|uniref:hypothetical protein n=1 Tax=Erwinia billingiae TaxID=182337 RepID=UPI0030CF1878
MDVITHPHPFAVVHQIDIIIQNDKDFSVLVSEYWNPQQDWFFFEYLVPEIKILEVIPLESLDTDTASIFYSSDVLKAEKL